MHLHSNSYQNARRLYAQAWGYLRDGAEVPHLLEIQCWEAGINLDAMREQAEFLSRAGVQPE